MVNLSRQFITQILQLFSSVKNKFSIIINFNEFFAGYRWRSYNHQIELQENAGVVKSSTNYEQVTPSESSQPTTNES